MNNNDIKIKMGNGKFNFRVAGIFEYEDRILIQKSENDNFYGLIGGRVKINEKTIDALKREIKEEIDFNVKEENCKLVRIYENFFEYNHTKFHELLFVYIIQLKSYDEIEKQKDFLCCDKFTTKMTWITKSQLDGIDIRPAEIKQIFGGNSLKHGIILE